jgi:molecular chaperone GrpE
MENLENSPEMKKEDTILDSEEKINEAETAMDETSEINEESNSSQVENENTATEGTSEIEELSKAKEDLAEAKDKYLRLYSEFENFRRRTAKEKLEMIQSANEQLVKAMLPVADDFERAENAITNIESKEVEGFLLIQSKFKKILDQYGVKPMTIEVGADFDADTHEAITQVPTPDENLKGKVIDVVEKGYLLNDKVIRYAKVVIGN